MIFGRLASDLAETKAEMEGLHVELRQNREGNDFVESDPNAWQEQLRQIKEELTNPQKLQVDEEVTALISKLRVSTCESSERFDRSFGSTIFEDNFKVVVQQGQSYGHTEVRGRTGYQAGRHVLKVKIEQLPTDGWIFFGIISKEAPLQEHSYNSSTAYGWSNRNQVLQAGVLTDSTTTDVAQDDTIHLMIDCDQRMIEFINQRTNLTLQRSADVTKCAVPWQLHLNLYHVATKVRIL